QRFIERERKLHLNRQELELQRRRQRDGFCLPEEGPPQLRILGDGPMSGVTAERQAPAELLAERDRLTEQFALMQSELGGLFYEMASRDHVQLDVLVARAAELQRVDGQLAQVQMLLDSGRESPLGGPCSQCGTVYARGAAYCSQCGTALAG